MTTPKLSALESKLYIQILAAYPEYNIRPEYDDDSLNLEEDKVVVIIKHLGDRLEGRTINPALLHPEYSFIVVSRTYLQAVKALENLIAFFNDTSANIFSDSNWAVTNFFKNRTIMPVYDQDTRYYYGTIDMVFHLTSCVI